eukprot:12484744-Alexandrium_andersonii.AAC.1
MRSLRAAWSCGIVVGAIPFCVIAGMAAYDLLVPCPLHCVGVDLPQVACTAVQGVDFGGVWCG